jgi:gamma-butyrobetaine dioxygenase
VLGARWLAALLPEAVRDPIRLHVEAKRYLCATDPAYRAGLSEGSERSLVVQGGPMAADEVARFERHPGAEAAVTLRRWDDRAKDLGADVPPLASWRPVVSALART